MYIHDNIHNVAPQVLELLTDRRLVRMMAWDRRLVRMTGRQRRTRSSSKCLEGEQFKHLSVCGNLRCDGEDDGMERDSENCVSERAARER
jgi:hypothetical protein